jgi:hypothetical protein
MAGTSASAKKAWKTIRANKKSEAGKKAWDTIRRNAKLKEIRLKITALKAWETRLQNQANR